MRIRTATPLASAALVAAGTVAPTVVVTPPASADVFGASIRHNDPDAGYDAPIKVRFANGEIGYVAEGGHSDHLQPNGQEDVAAVYVGANLEITRYYSDSGAGTWSVWLDAPGWHSIGDGTNAIVVHGKD